MQGNYSELQCSVPCNDRLYDNEETIKKMIAAAKDFVVPTSLLPKCPNCGAPLVPHLRADDRFVENNVWQEQNDAYFAFLKKAHGKKTVFMEFGVGFDTPAIIRYPFERMTLLNKHATLLRFNKYQSGGFAQNREKTVSFEEDMNRVLEDLNDHA